MFGVLGYILIEGWTPIEAIYMVVISLSTVGFREVRELDERGMVLTMLILLLGVGTLFYTLTTLAEYMIGGHLAGVWERRRMRREIASLRGHYIICGFGRVGQLEAADN